MIRKAWGIMFLNVISQLGKAIIAYMFVCVFFMYKHYVHISMCIYVCTEICVCVHTHTHTHQVELPYFPVMGEMINSISFPALKLYNRFSFLPVLG